MIPPDHRELIVNDLIAVVRRKLPAIKKDFAEFEEEYIDDLMYLVEEELDQLTSDVMRAVEAEVEKHGDNGEGRQTLGSPLQKESE